jgi:hypothetical protein
MPMTFPRFPPRVLYKNSPLAKVPALLGRFEARKSPATGSFGNKVPGPMVKMEKAIR